MRDGIIIMKTFKSLFAAGLVAGVCLPLAAFADDAKADKKDGYPLTTCVVSGEKLGGEMGKPFIYTHEGREVRLCCKGCLKDFKKDPAKYLKKLDDAEKAAKK